MGLHRTLEGMEPWRRNTLKAIAVLGAALVLLAMPSGRMTPLYLGPFGNAWASMKAAAWLACLVLGVVAFFLWSTRPNF